MVIRRRASLVLGASIFAAAIALSPVAPARAAASPGWRVVFSHTYGGQGSFAEFFAVTATSARDGWALGGTNVGGGGSGSPVAERWHGGRWQAAAPGRPARDAQRGQRTLGQ